MSEAVPLRVKAKWPPLKSNQNDVEITLPDVEVEFETQDTTVMMATLDSLTIAMNRSEETASTMTMEVKKPRKNAKIASAPPPLAVPPVAPAPPVVDNGIPPFLDRTGLVPPVPPLPNAPPVAPAPPPAPPAPNPTSALAIKVKAEVERRGDAIIPWLVGAGAVAAIPDLKLNEAAESMLYLAPDRLESVAKALSVQ